MIALSGRLEESRESTQQWLEVNYPWIFNKVLLTNYDTAERVPKYELANINGITVMIEDNAEYAIDLAKHWITTILLETPWNSAIKTNEYSNIIRVKDWEEIIHFLTH